MGISELVIVLFIAMIFIVMTVMSSLFMYTNTKLNPVSPSVNMKDANRYSFWAYMIGWMSVFISLIALTYIGFMRGIGSYYLSGGIMIALWFMIMLSAMMALFAAYKLKRATEYTSNTYKSPYNYLYILGIIQIILSVIVLAYGVFLIYKGFTNRTIDYLSRDLEMTLQESRYQEMRNQESRYQEMKPQEVTPQEVTPQEPTTVTVTKINQVTQPTSNKLPETNDVISSVPVKITLPDLGSDNPNESIPAAALAGLFN